MKIVITLEVSDVIELSSDPEIKREIVNLINDYHAYSLIKNHKVEIFR